MTVEQSAHGRVNLIGEHTDYNDGFVFPTSIPQKTTVTLRTIEGSQAKVRSGNIPGAEFTYVPGKESKTGQWNDYVQGVTWVLRRQGMQIPAFEAVIHSEVPMGSGLSSSAALEVALLKAFSKLLNLNLNPLDIAKMGQRVENDFVGARVGIMDQMAASLGVSGEALFIDTRDLKVDRITLPLDEIELMVINSGIAHNHTYGDYNQRRKECEEACQLLGIQSLRDLKLEVLESRKKDLPDLNYRRARHVVTENDRVLRAVERLAAKDFAGLGKLFNESHISMRDDYQVSIPEIDTLVEIAQSRSEVWGARLTGGGFGGSIVAICRPGTSKKCSEQICREYFAKTKTRATILVPASDAPGWR